jgi:TRAP-type uncharacterized transport system substrate-binding protein
MILQLLIILLISILITSYSNTYEPFYVFFTPFETRDVFKIDNNYSNSLSKYEYYRKLIKFGITHSTNILEQSFSKTLVNDIITNSKINNINIIKIPNNNILLTDIVNNDIEIGISDTPTIMSIINKPTYKDNITYVCNLQEYYIYVFTNKYTNIFSIDQLKGTRISVGIPYTTPWYVSNNIIDILGLIENDDYFAYNYNIEEAIYKLQQNELDIVFYADIYPSKYVLSLLKYDILHTVSLDNFNETLFINKYPYYTKTRYINEVITYKFNKLLVSNVNTDNIVIYEFIRKIFKTNNLHFQSTISSLQYINTVSKYKSKHTLYPEYINLVDSMYIDIHPGAKQYYLENNNITM